MTEKDKEEYRNNDICRFCEKNIECDKVRDHDNLTGRYRGPARTICYSNVTQKQSIFITIIFHNCSKYDCHMSFKKLVDKKKDEVDFDFIAKTNEEYISVSCDCIRFTHKYRFFSISLDSLVKTLVDNSKKN